MKMLMATSNDNDGDEYCYDRESDNDGGYDPDDDYEW